MGKGDWLKPRPDRNTLNVFVHPQVAVTISTDTNEVYFTDDSGYVRIRQPKRRHVNFSITHPGYHRFEFFHNFNSEESTLQVHLRPLEVNEPEPTGPIFGDWLTCRHEDGSLIYPSVYPVCDFDTRVRIIEAMKFNGYTDTFVDVAYSSRNNDDVFQHPGWNFLTSDPQPFIEACRDFKANGIRPILMVGYQKDIAPPFNTFKLQLAAFLEKTGHLLSGVVAGAEAEEYWSFGEIVEVLKLASRYTGGFLGYHGGRSSWGPDGGQSTQWVPGGRQVSWWKYMKEQIPGRELMLFYQYFHSRKLDNGGFWTPDEHIIEDTEILLTPQRLGDLGIKFIAAEYGYKCDPVLAKHMGDLARQHGAHGVMNGGSIL